MGNFEDFYQAYPDDQEDQPEGEPEFTSPGFGELQQAYKDMQREFEVLTLKLARANGAYQPSTQEPVTPVEPVIPAEPIVPVPGDETGTRSRQAKSCQEKFLPYNTMFKLDVRSQNGMENSPTPRVAVCVNCSASYPISYALKAATLGTCCQACRMCARVYWEDKPHRKVKDAETG